MRNHDRNKKSQIDLCRFQWPWVTTGPMFVADLGTYTRKKSNRTSRFCMVSGKFLHGRQLPRR